MKLFAFAVALVFSSGIVGCQTQADKDALQRAQDNFKLTEIKNFRDLNDEKHTAYVEGAERLYGEPTGRIIEQCYEDGYDSVQNDDHTFTNDPKLGPKYVARCDKIRKGLDAFYAKADKAHRKEISQ